MKGNKTKISFLAVILLASLAQAQADMVSNSAQSQQGGTGQNQQLIQLLQTQGLSQQSAQERLKFLTHREQQQMLANFATLPAGATGVEALLIVATGAGALLMTDAMGFTDVVPFISPEPIEKLEPVEHY